MWHAMEDASTTDSGRSDPGRPDEDPRRTTGAAHERGVRVEIADPHHHLTPEALAWLREHAALAADDVSSRLRVAGEARVLVVDDDEMRRVHDERSGINTTTDVLTFDLAADDDTLVDADVYVCSDEAARQAGERSIPVERELLLYTLHAMLHAVGFDDRDDAGFARMHATEDEILDAIGVGATFEPGGAR
ncbi:MAG: rRNA maturation RNase YbeY [Phycisphaerales bacterium]